MIIKRINSIRNTLTSKDNNLQKLIDKYSVVKMTLVTVSAFNLYFISKEVVDRAILIKMELYISQMEANYNEQVSKQIEFLNKSQSLDSDIQQVD